MEDAMKQLDRLNKALTEYDLQEGYTSGQTLVYESLEEMAIKYKDINIMDINDPQELTNYIQANHKHYIVYSSEQEIFVGVKKLKVNK